MAPAARLAALACVLCQVRLAVSMRAHKGRNPPNPNVGPTKIPPPQPMRIPKIIHWCFDAGGKPMPEEISDNLETWMVHHPEWQVMQWDEASNRGLIMQHYPWFLETYDSLQTRMMRMDASRYAYLHHYGGLYTDADTNASRPIDPYLGGDDIVFLQFGCRISTYFMAAVPGHPFFLSALQHLRDVHKQQKRLSRVDSAATLCKTGWGMVTQLWTKTFNGTTHERRCATTFHRTLASVPGTTYSMLSLGTYKKTLGITHQRLAIWKKGLAPAKPLSLLQLGTGGMWWEDDPHQNCEDEFPGWRSSFMQSYASTVSTRTSG